MAETVEELMEKHTRRELDKMAYELGVDTTDVREYPYKRKVAEAILRARGAEEAPAEEVEKVAEVPEEKLEAPPIEEKPPKPRIGKKGVLAKRVAMDRKAKEIEKGAKDVQAGIKSQAKENEDAVARMNSDVQAQAKENEEAVAKIDAGVKEIQSAMKDKAGEIDAGAKEVQSGIEAQAKENEEAVAKMHSNMEAQAKENANAVAKIGTGVKELQNAAKEYIKDFYYG